MHKRVLCFDKTDDELREKIFADWKMFDNFSEDTFLEIYESLRAESDHKKFLNEYIPEIKSYLEERNKFRKKHCDVLCRHKYDKEAYWKRACNYEQVLMNLKQNIDMLAGIWEGYSLQHKAEFILEYCDILRDFPKCEILILHNITCDNNKVWLELVADANKSNPIYKADLVIASLKQGETIEKFPETFISMFNVIDLSRHAEDVGPEVRPEGKKIVPPGTKWSGVKMVINYGRRKPIDILIDGKQISKIDFSDIGLKYSKTKTPKPIEAMKTFKKFVESENNTVPSKNVKFHHRKTLKDKFCHHFGISEDPFFYIKDEKAYKTLFSIEYKHYTNYPSA